MTIMRFGLKNERVKYSFPLRYLNRGPLELKASVLTMSYTMRIFVKQYLLKSKLDLIKLCCPDNLT